MPESFGARLRQQRERRQVPLATIAAETKIKQSLLEALERDDVSQWPSGIFRRAFIRGYAHAIGLEPDATVREFLERHPDPAEEVSNASTAAIEGADGAAPPTRLRQLVGSAFSSLQRLGTGTAPRPAATNHFPVPPARRFPLAAETLAPPFEKTPEHVPVSSRNLATVPAVPAPSETDLLAAADLCTAFGRARRTDDLSPLFQEVNRILGAAGLVVWIWDPGGERLRAAWAHGYSDAVLASLPAVARDANNATAAAFRSARTRSLAASDRARGALVVPLITARGCVGVLAIELQQGREMMGWLTALTTIFAAQLARVLEERRLGAARVAPEPGRPDRRQRQAMTLAAP